MDGDHLRKRSACGSFVLRRRPHAIACRKHAAFSCGDGCRESADRCRAFCTAVSHRFGWTPGDDRAVGRVLLWTPLYLQAAAWLAGFGVSGWFTVLTAGPYQAGLLDGWPGTIWVHALAAIPWVVLIVGAGLRFVEPELEEAALLDGRRGEYCGDADVCRRALAIGLAAVWVALAAATDMTVTDLFQVRTYAEEIYTGAWLAERRLDRQLAPA